jgi:hypothetical protein
LLSKAGKSSLNRDAFAKAMPLPAGTVPRCRAVLIASGFQAILRSSHLYPKD